jgi:hypothetical protein
MVVHRSFAGWENWVGPFIALLLCAFPIKTDVVHLYTKRRCSTSPQNGWAVTDVSTRWADGEYRGDVSERMKQLSTVQLSIKSNALLLVVAVFLSIGGALESGCTGCRVAPRPTPSQRPAEALRKDGTLTSVPPDTLLICPTLGSSRVPATLRVIGRHKVVLS